MDHHEVYGTEIPCEVDTSPPEADNSRAQEIEMETENVKKRMKEVEKELRVLRQNQANIEKAAQEDSAGASITQAEMELVDARSIYVGNVDYACTPEEIHQHFRSCGTVNRVTILTDKFGHPKGYAFVELSDVEAVQKALLLNETELHSRQLKVSAKRTNVPGMAQYRGRGRRPNLYFGYRNVRRFWPY